MKIIKEISKILFFIALFGFIYYNITNATRNNLIADIHESEEVLLQYPDFMWNSIRPYIDTTLDEKQFTPIYNSIHNGKYGEFKKDTLSNWILAHKKDSIVFDSTAYYKLSIFILEHENKYAELFNTATDDANKHNRLISRWPSKWIFKNENYILTIKH